jgi:hypothetical protein
MSKRKVKATQQDITQAAFEALIEKHNGRIGPRTLVDEARDPTSPFHDFFEWDDEEAGDQYRLIQASQLIRKWKGSVMRVDAETKTVKIETVRRVQSPSTSRAKGADSYETVESIMADPAKRDDMLRTVLRELSAYRRRYAQLVALADVWRAIDEAIDLHVPEQKRPAAGDEDAATV